MQNKKGFSIVELIIVMFILSILGIIAYFSYIGYEKSSRDAVRISRIDSMGVLLDLYKTNNGIFPIPDEKVDIIYNSGIIDEVLWSQGLFGKNVVKKTGTMSDDFLDPLTKTYFSYSIINRKDEYQIGTIMEDKKDMIKGKYAYVAGNYNGKITKFKKGDSEYIFATPSILISDVSNPNILDIFQKNIFIYNGFGNIPDTYTGKYNSISDGFNYGKGYNPIIFKGDITSLSDINILKNIYNRYRDIINHSDLKNVEPYKNIGNLLSLKDIVKGILPFLNPNIDIDDYEYPPDPWIWNNEHTLGCKRNTLSKIECKWEGLDIDTSDPENIRVQLQVNDKNCEYMTGEYLDNGPTIIQNKVTAWCGSSFSGSVNMIRLDYTDTNGDDHITSNTLDIPLTPFELSSNFFTSNATGFDFDLSSLSMIIDKDYSFGIGNEGTGKVSNCDEIYGSGIREGRIDIEENCGGTNFGIPIPDGYKTTILIRDADTKEDFSTTSTKMLGIFNIDKSYFVEGSDYFDFDLTNHPEIQDLLDASGYTIRVINSKGEPKNCTNRLKDDTKSGRIGDEGGISCGRLFNDGDDRNYDIYLTYGSSGNNSFHSNTINLGYTN